MKNAVKVYTFLTLAFLIILGASAHIPEPWSLIVRMLAFALPGAVGFYASRRFKREREEAAGVSEAESTLIGLSSRSIPALLPLVAPTIAIIFLISFLTSLLLTALGFESSSVADAPLYEMLLAHALMPAVLEEFLFRYVPMKLLAPYSKRWCIILSSLYFALIHMNMFQLPYALAAGFIFILLDIAFDSILPSLLLHLLNNSISVVWIKYSASREFSLWYTVILISLAVISLVPIIIRRREYLAGLKRSLDAGETLTERTAPMMFVSFTLLMTVLNLL